MVAYWLIFAVVVYVAIRNWRRAVLLWFPFQLLFNECVCLKYTSPAVTLVLAVDVAILCIAFYRGAFRQREKFIFAGVTAFYALSYAISESLSGLLLVSGLNDIKYFILNFFFVMLLQKSINTKEDVRLLAKLFIVVVFAIVGLAVSEVVLKDNVVLDYVYYNAPQNLIDGKMYYVPPGESLSGELQIRYGGVRAYSFFHIHIFFGSTCILLAYLYYYFSTRNNLLFKKHTQTFVVCVFLSLLGAFLSNSKTPLVGMLPFLVAMIGDKRFFNAKTLMVCFAVVIIIFMYFPSYLTNIMAIFDDSVAQEGGGSSLAMRMIQFENTFMLFLQSPIWGHGMAPTFSANMKDLILGMESSLMQVPVTRGILGLASYFGLYYTAYRRLKGKVSTKLLSCLIVSIVGMEAVTGQQNLALILGVFVVLYKCSLIFGTEARRPERHKNGNYVEVRN